MLLETIVKSLILSAHISSTDAYPTTTELAYNFKINCDLYPGKINYQKINPLKKPDNYDNSNKPERNYEEPIRIPSIQDDEEEDEELPA